MINTDGQSIQKQTAGDAVGFYLLLPSVPSIQQARIQYKKLNCFESWSIS